MRYILGLLRSKLIYEHFPGRRQRMTSFYRSLVKPGQLCFDVGAHLGNRTAVLAALGCKVVAVEPHPYLAAYLRKKFAGLASVVVEEVGVSATPGEATLHSSPRNLTISSFEPKWTDALRAVRADDIAFTERHVVPTVTLTQLIARHGRPAYCKIDVEGLDSEVVESLEEPLPIISFEHLPARPAETAAALEHLERLGPYRFNFFPRETHAFRLPSPVAAAEVLAALAAVSPPSPCDVFGLLQ